MRAIFVSMLSLLFLVATAAAQASDSWRSKSEDEWKKTLTPQQFEICRKAGTERPFSGRYNEHKGEGVYKCSSCGNVLFTSEAKFESGTGWPSFSSVLDPNTVELVPDQSHGMERVEVRCARCGAHLGHVFDDGPAPTGKRYCINSVCLDFEPR